ncbi:MAG: VanZ family protein [Planctomycetes bacterium]|nr:VanZ family protein [Planctomycetota bacterium]
MEALRALVGRLRGVHPAAGVALTLGWMGLVWSLSARENLDLAGGTAAGAWLTNLAHAPEYAALATWLALAARRPGSPVAPAPRAACWIVVACALFGVTDELHQSSVPGRDASALDVVTDVVGATVAVLALRAAADRRRFARVVLWGLGACLAAAAVATLLTSLYPEISWL